MRKRHIALAVAAIAGIGGVFKKQRENQQTQDEIVEAMKVAIEASEVASDIQSQMQPNYMKTAEN